ncbi:glycosyltransferase [Paucibacter sp. R3-3]|uniref:Glycosyltransferase n=1 Tax=Roseateles agri TaxID=3098619 RepID=A0ABU5DML6_9BURK|nr:glycosyltransferase [Paucibacter sp. R3-3]MDY0747547.1 glycosyltransferase [Paucibacter sp. R3-3]
MKALPPLLVFSHLRWGFVHQRPQHLLTRLARHWRVIYVEEPVRVAPGAERLEERQVGDAVTLLVPHTSVEAGGFHDDQLPALQAQLADWLQVEQISEALVWLYTPMALPLVKLVRPRLLIYDCMDELSAFLAAPRQLRQRETALLRSADLVFTGGPSLYEAKRHLHPRVSCVPSAVDATHFARGGSPEAKDAAQALQRHLPYPRLGFFGVIDERLDIVLLTQLADARPDWQLVMVGPVVKIDPAALPRRANVHWLGMQDYQVLPALLRDWDLCLLPFALNEATRFISPTKTLEYLAAGKPVVSTAIRDVSVLYGEAVHVAGGGKDFVQACAAELSRGADQQRHHRAKAAALVAANSWDRSAAKIVATIEQALGGRVLDIDAGDLQAAISVGAE